MKHDRDLHIMNPLAEPRSPAQWGRIGDVTLLVDDLMREVEAKCGPMRCSGLRYTPNLLAKD